MIFSALYFRFVSVIHITRLRPHEIPNHPLIKPAPNPVAPKRQFVEAIQRDLPCPDLLRKIFRFARWANQNYKPRRLVPKERGVGHRHERWDGMRWTRQRRCEADSAGRVYPVSDIACTRRRRQSPV